METVDIYGVLVRSQYETNLVLFTDVEKYLKFVEEEGEDDGLSGVIKTWKTNLVVPIIKDTQEKLNKLSSIVVNAHYYLKWEEGAGAVVRHALLETMNGEYDKALELLNRTLDEQEENY